MMAPAPVLSSSFMRPACLERERERERASFYSLFFLNRTALLLRP